jgi:hypothetical protein
MLCVFFFQILNQVTWYDCYVIEGYHVYNVVKNTPITTHTLLTKENYTSELNHKKFYDGA